MSTLHCTLLHDKQICEPHSQKDRIHESSVAPVSMVTGVSERLHASSHTAHQAAALNHALPRHLHVQLQMLPETLLVCTAHRQIQWRRLCLCTSTLPAATTIDAVRQLASRLLATGIWDHEEPLESASADRQEGTVGGGKQNAVLVTSFDENKCSCSLII